MSTEHASAVGPVVDVGTPASGKVQLSAIGHLLMAAIPGVPAIWVLVSIAVNRAAGVVMKDGSDVWIFFLVGLPTLLVAWPIFATSVRRFRAAAGSWYLRAGPGGIAYRLPGSALWKSGSTSACSRELSRGAGSRSGTRSSSG
jgi:hypothetical protein